MMIEKRAIDPVESILQFKRMVEWMAGMPEENLKISNVASHICSQKMMEILDVDMICLFIKDINNDTNIHKYTIRSKSCEEFCTSVQGPSIVKAVLQSGKILKYSHLKDSDFNTEIDGCLGVVVQNIMSVPIKNERSGESIGAIHLINKLKGKVAFTELDEMISTVFSLMAVTAVTGCIKFQHLSYRADVLTSILEAPINLLALLPSRNELFAKVIHPGEVISVLENTCQQSLKCLKVKAFLLSDRQIQTSVESEIYLISRRPKGTNSPQLRRGAVPPVDFHSIDIGIIGLVARTKKWSVRIDGEHDAHFSHRVDLDPQGQSCVTVPILSVEGDVLACVQMVLGPGSPKMKLSDSRSDGITFDQTVQWLVRSLCTPLQYVIEGICGNEKRRDRTHTPLDTDGLTSLISRFPSADTVEREKFLSFTEQEILKEQQQRDHLISLGISVPDEKKEIEYDPKTILNISSDGGTPTGRRNRRSSV